MGNASGVDINELPPEIIDILEKRIGESKEVTLELQIDFPKQKGRGLANDANKEQESRKALVEETDVKVTPEGIEKCEGKEKIETTKSEGASVDTETVKENVKETEVKVTSEGVEETDAMENTERKHTCA